MSKRPYPFGAKLADRRRAARSRRRSRAPCSSPGRRASPTRRRRSPARTPRDVRHGVVAPRRRAGRPRPPRAAYSHSASVGSRPPDHAQNASASYQLTSTTGWSRPLLEAGRAPAHALAAHRLLPVEEDAPAVQLAGRAPPRRLDEAREGRDRHLGPADPVAAREPARGGAGSRPCGPRRRTSSPGTQPIWKTPGGSEDVGEAVDGVALDGASRGGAGAPATPPRTRSTSGEPGDGAQRGAPDAARAPPRGQTRHLRIVADAARPDTRSPRRPSGYHRRVDADASDEDEPARRTSVAALACAALVALAARAWPRRAGRAAGAAALPRGAARGERHHAGCTTTRSRPTASCPRRPAPGAAFLDYDDDGWMDVYLVNSGPCDLFRPRVPLANALYRNNGNGTFTDVTDKAGVAGGTFGMGAFAADYDNDGYTDLYVTAYGRATLYHNKGNGTFTDVTDEAGVAVPGWTTTRRLLRLRRRREARPVRRQLRPLRARHGRPPAAARRTASATTACRASSSRCRATSSATRAAAASAT